MVLVFCLPNLFGQLLLNLHLSFKAMAIHDTGEKESQPPKELYISLLILS
jgi:hypothetical protein